MQLNDKNTVRAPKAKVKYENTSEMGETYFQPSRTLTCSWLSGSYKGTWTVIRIWTSCRSGAGDGRPFETLRLFFLRSDIENKNLSVSEVVKICTL